MAQAVQKLFPQAKLAIGPATADSFYYDFDLVDGHTFTSDDLIKIEEEMKNIIKQNLTFEKYEVKDVDAKIAEFKGNAIKLLKLQVHIGVVVKRTKCYREFMQQHIGTKKICRLIWL